jgi:hypothetical protein
MVAILFVWGGVKAPGVIHDEQAYLLQAQIFASGHLRGVAPPIPEFFQQMHVLTDHRLAPKYPPGHAVVLVPGVVLGLPGLVPVALSGVAAVLMFVTVRAVGGPVVALLAWVLWLTSEMNLLSRASYLSEVTTSALWLLALACLWRWERHRRLSMLVVVALAFGWMLITRPLTAVALGAPASAFIVWRAYGRGLMHQVLIGAACVVPIVTFNLVWQKQVTGRWLGSPQLEYARLYIPFDKPGFGADQTPPVNAPNADVAWITDEFLPVHAAHTIARLPRTVALRIVAILAELGGGWRGALLVFALLGARVSPRPVLFAEASALCLLAAYLVYAHPPRWTVYYLEIVPVFHVLAALGIVSFWRRGLSLESGGAAGAAGILIALAAPWLVMSIMTARRAESGHSAFHRKAQAVLSEVRDPEAVVFVRYPAEHSRDFTITGNVPDYRSARLWIVPDRAGDDERLLSLTTRPAYRLDTSGWKWQRLR